MDTPFLHTDEGPCAENWNSKVRVAEKLRVSHSLCVPILCLAPVPWLHDRDEKAAFQLNRVFHFGRCGALWTTWNSAAQCALLPSPLLPSFPSMAHMRHSCLNTRRWNA